MSQLPDSLGSADRYRHVQFAGDEIITVVLDEGVAVPVRTICLALGLDVQTQSQRLREHEVLMQGLRMVRVQMGNGVRTVIALLHRYIPFWLATITPGHVHPDVRPKLIRYQIELVDVLAALYGNELPTVERPVTESLSLALQQQLNDALLQVRLLREALLTQHHGFEERLQTQSQSLHDHEQRIGTVELLVDTLQQDLASQTTISAHQQEVIKRAITHMAQRYKRRHGTEIFGKLFGEFCMHLGTPKYALLPASKYPAALAWLQDAAQRYLPDDPQALPPLQEALL